jgi:hypothetical protein
VVLQTKKSVCSAAYPVSEDASSAAYPTNSTPLVNMHLYLLFYIMVATSFGLESTKMHSGFI